MLRFPKLFALALLAAALLSSESVGSQNGSRRARGAPRPVTIPVTIKVDKPETEIRVVDLLVREDGEVQSLLSIRRPADNPITLAVLLQDDLVSSVANEARGLARFIRNLPAGSRVMVGYIRSGSLEVRRRFTTELERAATSVRPPLGSTSASPYNPYVEIIEALRRFDSQPLGRRAIIVVSDGLDISRGVDNSSPAQSIDLARAISQAQRRSVAIYSIYAPSAFSAQQLLGTNGQSSLLRLSDETGGRAFFQGTSAPVSFQPFLDEISSSLERQIALTYLSTHPSKGFHRLDVKPLDRDVEVRHPAGYTR